MVKLLPGGEMEKYERVLLHLLSGDTQNAPTGVDTLEAWSTLMDVDTLDALTELVRGNAQGALNELMRGDTRDALSALAGANARGVLSALIGPNAQKAMRALAGVNAQETLNTLTDVDAQEALSALIRRKWAQMPKMMQQRTGEDRYNENGTDRVLEKESFAGAETVIRQIAAEEAGAALNRRLFGGGTAGTAEAVELGESAGPENERVAGSIRREERTALPAAADMQAISEYFRRDSRRYDGGFKRY